MSTPSVPGAARSGRRGSFPPQRPGQPDPVPVDPRRALPPQAPPQTIQTSAPPARSGAAPTTPPQATPAAPEQDDVSFVRQIPFGDPPLLRTWHTVSRMFASTRATRELADLAAEVQAPVRTGRRIAVTSVHGGAGKSTVAAVLASVFAARRADAVLAADADPYEGSLTWRLSTQAPPSLERLAPELIAARGGDLGALKSLLPRTGTGLWLLPSGAANPNLCTEVTRALSRLFAIAVTDCLSTLESAGTAAAAADAHSVVICAAATPDGVRATYRSLRKIADTGYGAWLSRVLVVLSAGSPDGRAALREGTTRKLIEQTGVPVVTLPYDRHLAAGALITPSRLGEKTLVEATRAAGLALTRARRR
ncbi:hypothetical protein ACLQ28_14775 [Micromonospora sp. DT201]|uniref:nucleotide-binding protein n=1 Tax=Micromonospora sp. DT201 TaxID=3393442 RepID=UPI003CE675ED